MMIALNRTPQTIWVLDCICRSLKERVMISYRLQKACRASNFIFATLLALTMTGNAGAAQGDCSQPISSGDIPVAGDCLFILQASLGLTTCSPECICDVNAMDGITATDGLICLQVSVGQEGAQLGCDCSGTTTTSTTTTTVPVGIGDVINESCQVCHGEGRLVDVGEAHPGLQTLADVSATIDNVTIDVDDMAQTAVMTVEFTVTDEDGSPIANLGTPSERRPERFAYLRFALAELMPPAQDSGDPDTWVSYTTGDRNPLNLTDNGDGTYVYVFETNLYPLYMPALRHRLLLMVFGDIVEQALNVTYDFVPDQLPGPFTFDLSRDIVATASCNECHGRLGSGLGDASFHGGSRYTTEACATCHTSTLGGGLAEFTPLVHGIHAAKLISDDPEDPIDFTEVTYPQDLRNCTKCHAGPDGENWNMRPSIVACGSCHDEVDFATGDGHVGGAQADNSGCVGCHSSEDIIEAHLTEEFTPNNPDVPEGLSEFEWVLEDVMVNENNEAVVTFHINRDGAPLDLMMLPEDLSRGPSFLLAYALPQDGVDEPADYNQLGRTAGQPASVSLGDVILTGTPDSYSGVLSGESFPEGATMRAVALQGYYNQSIDLDGDGTPENIARHTKSVVRGVTGDAERRTVVDNAKCLNCHEPLSLHGGNRVNEVGVCVICHNPNLSSSGKVADTTQTDQDEKDAIAAAGYDPEDALTWPEATQNFKNMVHGIHAAGVREYDYEHVRNRNNGIYYNWSEVTFPGILSNCETCHLPDTYGPDDIPEGALVTTDFTTDGLNLTQEAVEAARDSVPNETDLIHSVTAGACYMCHDNAPAAAHMAQNGGVIDIWRAQALGD
jgi:OmcA/MtrC family decaheme c-type cytochrome